MRLGCLVHLAPGELRRPVVEIGYRQRDARQCSRKRISRRRRRHRAPRFPPHLTFSSQGKKDTALFLFRTQTVYTFIYVYKSRRLRTFYFRCRDTFPFSDCRDAKKGLESGKSSLAISGLLLKMETTKTGAQLEYGWERPAFESHSIMITVARTEEVIVISMRVSQKVLVRCY